MEGEREHESIVFLPEVLLQVSLTHMDVARNVDDVVWRELDELFDESITIMWDRSQSEYDNPKPAVIQHDTYSHPRRGGLGVIV